MSKTLDRIAEEALTLLKRRGNEFYPPGQLAYRLQVNLERLEEALQQLKSWGYKVKRSKDRGYKLVGVPDLLTSLEIREGLKTKILGSEIHSFYTVQSTNQVAYRLAEAGAKEGTIVIAEEQSAGKGRLSRHWHSPAGMGIWLSLILRPKIPLENVPALSLCACLACVRTASHMTGKVALIKWPNDSYLNGKKFSGVLTELSAELDRVDFVILGIGINLNQTARDFPRQLKGKATSLKIEVKRKISRVEFLWRFLLEFEEIYQKYQSSGLRAFKSEIMKNFFLLGRKVTIEVGDKKISGTALDLNSQGALVLNTAEGMRVITAGDVTLIR